MPILQVPSQAGWASRHLGAGSKAGDVGLRQGVGPAARACPGLLHLGEQTVFEEGA